MFSSLKKCLFVIGFLQIANIAMSQNSKINTIQYDSFDAYPVYLKDDLGMNYSDKETTIKLWSPNVQETKINLYKQGNGGEAFAEKSLDYDPKTGVWQIVLAA